MGFKYRKSINLGGGFRINVSKSGIGYSWGYRGYRVTKTAKGTIRKTVSLPGTGISFVDESNKVRKNPQSNPTDRVKEIDKNYYDTEEIINGSANNIVSDGLEELLERIRKSLLIDTLSNIGTCISLFLGFIISPFFLAFLCFIILKIYIRKVGNVELDYTIDADQQEIIDRRLNTMFKIANSSRVWRIIQTSKVIDRKYEAGASDTVKRVTCKATTKAPFPFKTKSPVVTFKSKNETLIFLPDKLFIIQKSKVGALNYSDIKTSIHNTHFIESESVPRGAVIEDYTWKYVNKNGGPDKRFKNNCRFPICLYGEVELKSSSGLNTVFMFSDSV